MERSERDLTDPTTWPHGGERLQVVRDGEGVGDIGVLFANRGPTVYTGEEAIPYEAWGDVERDGWRPA